MKLLHNVFTFIFISNASAFITNGIKFSKIQYSSAVFAVSDEKPKSFDARTCPKNFLTQRSIQSFVFLLKQLRDPHTVSWIEEFLGCNGMLLTYHGLGALDLKRFALWDSVMNELMDAPNDVVIVKMKQKKSRRTMNSFANSLSSNSVQKYTPPTPNVPRNNGGGYLDALSAKTELSAKKEISAKHGSTSKNDRKTTTSKRSQKNRRSSKKKRKAQQKQEVFLSKDSIPEEEHPIKIEIDIDPPSLANRILSVRQRIADEWSSDLDLLVSVNQKILASYGNRIKNERDNEELKKDSDMKSHHGENREGYESLGQDQVSGAFNFGQRTVQKFDRYTVYLLNNHPSFNDMYSSPLRASNFDLLLLLSTQESIHRVLNSYKKSGENKEVSFAWLKEFYTEKIKDFFDGDQSFGRADDFMDELLGTTPLLKSLPGGKMGFIDPLAIAEDIIDEREVVANEWKDVMKNVSNEHQIIRKEIWIRQMARWGQPISNNAKNQVESQVQATKSGDFE